MPDVKTALAALKKAASKAKVKKEITHTLELISGSLSLLASASLSSRECDNLVSRVRRPFVLLYETLLVPSLSLSVAIFNDITTKKLLVLLKAGDVDNGRRWELVATAILSGILDFLDSHPEEKMKDSIAAAFYSAICDICLPRDPTIAIRLSVPLRTTAYMVLSDTAALFPKNQEKLRAVKLLGGKRLGAVLYRTKDYLVLENILTLLGRIIPANTAAGTKSPKRTEFLRQVFVLTCPQGKQAMAKELTDIMESAPTTDWDNTVMTVVEVLARADISYPQPFGLDVVHACGTAFPQPTPSDRLYVDRSSFFANVANEEDTYETMQVPYASVLEISVVKTPGAPISSVTIALSVAPTVAEEPMKIIADAPLIFAFDIQNVDFERFMQAIDSRGLKVHVIEKGKPSKPTRISLTQTSARLEFTSEGDVVKDHPTFQDKVKTVQQLYKTNDPSDDVSLTSGPNGRSESGALPFDDLINYPATPPKASMSDTCAPSRDKSPTALSNPHCKAHAVLSHTAGTMLAPTAPPTPVSNPQRSTIPPSGVGRTDTQILRDNIFGTSDDELSDISDAEDKPTRKIASRRSTKVQNDDTKVSADLPLAKKGKALVKTLQRGRMILESDDDLEPPPRPAASKIFPRKRRVVESDSDVDSPTKEVPEPLLAVKTPTRKPSLIEVSNPRVTPGPVNDALLDEYPSVSRNQAHGQGNQGQFLEDTAKSPVGDMSNRGLSPAPKKGKSKPTSSTSVLDQTGTTIKEPEAVESITAGLNSALNRSTRVSAAAMKKGGAAGATNKANTSERITKRTTRLSKTVDEVPIGAEKLNASHGPAKQKKSTHAITAELTSASTKAPGRKRKAFEVIDLVDTPDKETRDEQSVKRARGDTVPENAGSMRRVSLASKKTARPLARKYDHKAKGNKISSPARHEILSTANFDSIPGISSDPIEVDSSSPLSQRIAKKSSRTSVNPAPALTGRMTRAAAMKDRTNKARPVVEPEIQRSKPGRKKHTVPLDEDDEPVVLEDKKPALALTVESKALQTPVHQKERMNVDDSKSSNHDSVQIQTTTAPSEFVTTEKSKKPTRAPWETQEFSDMVQQKSSSSPSKMITVKQQDCNNSEAVDDIPGDPMDLPTTEVTSIPCTPSPPLPDILPRALDERAPVNHCTDNAEETLVDLGPASPKFELERSAVPMLDKRPQNATKKEGLAVVITKAKELIPPAPLVKAEDVEMIDLTAESPVKRSVIARSVPSSVALPKSTAISVKSSNIRMVPEPSPATPGLAKAPSYVGEEEAVLHSPGISSEKRSLLKEGLRSARDRIAGYLEVEPVSVRRNVIDSKEVPSSKRRNRVTFAPEMREDPDTPFNLKKGLLCVDSNRDRTDTSKQASSIHRRDISAAGGSRGRSYDERRQSEPGMDAIIEVLSEIQEVIVQKISSKVEGVRHEVRMGRKMLLQDSAADLQAMRNESILHFNRLIDLESEYAGYARKIGGKWEEMQKVNEEIQGQLRRTIQDHDRKSLVKKMPKMPFAINLPPSCRKCL
ncbi:hypothetical protein NEOLEDRAFT_199803 [Neolentinus lepideus HHB14362 ss-1]|uniref:Uncharacterized protein n=1 Tax=Neolentinus lepideus HHB14362 ss-1 TaxID=1314782 RepID=A0A165THI4_9AGAM|nr:hypothetical protein NEOLEDRAFT_199803 [Neolentinus lepideus HHB14362 ss-1]